MDKLTEQEISGRADALLSGLKVGRMPDGKHFASDIGAIIAFAKWYAKRLTTPEAQMVADRERLVSFIERFSFSGDGITTEVTREAAEPCADALLSSGVVKRMPTKDTIATALWSTRIEIAGYWDKPSQRGEVTRGSAEALTDIVLALFRAPDEVGPD